MRILNGGFKFFEKTFRNVCANDGSRITGKDAIKLEREHLILLSQPEDPFPYPSRRGHTCQEPAAWEPKGGTLQ